MCSEINPIHILQVNRRGRGQHLKDYHANTPLPLLDGSAVCKYMQKNDGGAGVVYTELHSGFRYLAQKKIQLCFLSFPVCLLISPTSTSDPCRFFSPW